MVLAASLHRLTAGFPQPLNVYEAELLQPFALRLGVRQRRGLTRDRHLSSSASGHLSFVLLALGNRLRLFVARSRPAGCGEKKSERQRRPEPVPATAVATALAGRLLSFFLHKHPSTSVVRTPSSTRDRCCHGPAPTRKSFVGVTQDFISVLFRRVAHLPPTSTDVRVALRKIRSCPRFVARTLPA